MSAQLVQGYPQTGDCTEREKDPTQYKAIANHGGACAEERQDGEQSKVARFGTPSIV